MMDAGSAGLARNWWAVAIRGVLGIIVGVIALTQPGAAMLSLAWLLGAYLVVDGVFGIVAAVRSASQHHRWGLLLLEGVVSLVVGIMTWFFPLGTILAGVLLIAGWAVVTGVLMLVSSFRLHHSHGRVWLALGGIVSLIWGLMLAILPMSGAVVLTWWFGAYALLFGIMLVVLAVRLHHQSQRGLIA